MTLTARIQVSFPAVPLAVTLASFTCVFELQMMCLHVLFKCCEPIDFPTPYGGSMLLCSLDLKESYWKLSVNSPVFDLQFNQS